MKASSQHFSTVDANAISIDDDAPQEVTVTVVNQAPHQVNAGESIEVINQGAPSPSSSSALTTTKGNFSAFLAPLTQDTFKQVVTDVEEKLKVVQQTLGMLDILDSQGQGFDSVLEEMLRSITLKTGELLNADRTTIFLIDDERDELWSIVAKDENGKNLELRFPKSAGIVGEVATLKKVVNISYDFYNDPRSTTAQQSDKKTGYRTYTMLALPLLNEETGELVAVVQLINKLRSAHNPQAQLSEKIDMGGFTAEDEQVFREFAPSIRLILESSKSFYIVTQKQRAAAALMSAVSSLSKSSLDLEDTLNQVMGEAKKLMNADRSTLWLVDDERNDLWTKIPGVGELRCPMGVGFAGQVAATGEPINIGFDLYNHSNAENSKKTDQKTGYRTCSLLCMPVFNADGKLIGVTQLLNKRKQGDYPPYNPEDWPAAPEVWKASFNRSDQEFMQAFNIQAGVALQNAKLFATVKQQEQMQRDILRSLTNGVISTDKAGHIIAMNESAKQLLGFTPEDILEGRPVYDLLKIKEGDFSKWFNDALTAKEAKKRHQYYPDQTLVSGVKGGVEEHSIHLSINSIADARDISNVYGALVVMDDISDEKRLKSTMYRYMTQELAEQLLASGETKMGGDRKEVSVLFSDIRGYTTLTENMEAEDVVQMLNDYFESMVEAVFKHKGTLDKYIGDAIMAVFGSPLPLEDHAWMAVQTAVEMRHRLLEFNHRRQESNHPQIRIGIGINSDSVISGNIGSSKRMEFTAIGDGVNLSSRLEGASKQYGCDIVISEYTLAPCKDRIWYRELDRIRVKGKNNPVSIFELVALRDEKISDVQQKVIDYYRQGREYYLERKFTRAMVEFGAIVEELGVQDKAALLHLERIQHWLKNPPTDESWEEGVWTMQEK